MPTRLIGTDSDDPWLPEIVKSHAAQAKIEDTAGHFDATDVEGALAELAMSGSGVANAVVNGGGVATIVKLGQAAYDALSPPDSQTLYVIVGP